MPFTIPATLRQPWTLLWALLRVISGLGAKHGNNYNDAWKVVITHLFLPPHTPHSFSVLGYAQVYSRSVLVIQAGMFRFLLTNCQSHQAYRCPAYLYFAPDSCPDSHAVSRLSRLFPNPISFPTPSSFPVPPPVDLRCTHLYSATVLDVLVVMFFLLLLPDLALLAGTLRCRILRFRLLPGYPCSFPVSWLFPVPALSRSLALVPSVGGGEGG